jgi:hypothetical protein
MTDIPVKYNPISKARDVGKSLAGDLGEKAFVELELAYATRLLPRFTDDPTIRINQNVLLHWQRGYFKSTILKVFGQVLPLKTVDITSMTLEKMFGSIDEKKIHIIPPAFTNDTYFVTISELTALLGQRDAMRQLANTMNLVLEGERVARQTLKLGHGQIDEKELSTLKTKGVEYIAEIGELSYVPNVCVFAATRPLDNLTFTYLNKSGHFSRYHVLQYRISEREASDYLHKEYKLDQVALAQLRETNLALCNIKVRRVLRPSEELMKPVYDTIEELARDGIQDRKGFTLADVISPRLKGDITRELVAHAFARTAAENGFTEIEDLQYTQEDVDFVLQRPYHFIEFALNPIIAEDFSKIPQIKKLDRLKSAITIYLSDGAERNFKEVLSARAVSSISSCQASVYNALVELIEEGKVTRPRHGYYSIVKKEEGVVEGDKK